MSLRGVDILIKTAAAGPKNLLAFPTTTTLLTLDDLTH